MAQFSREELTEALRAVDSVIHKCEKAQEKFPNGTSHHTLLKNRLNAMYISKALIEDELKGVSMADTEKKLLVLSQIAGELNRRGVVWAVGGSLLLYLKGIAREFRDLDLMVAEADAERAAEALSGMGNLLPGHADAKYATRRFLEYEVDGVDVDLMAGFAIMQGSIESYFPLEKEHILETAVVNCAEIPLQSVAQWRTHYALMGRQDKVELIDQFEGKKG